MRIFLARINRIFLVFSIYFIGINAIICQSIFWDQTKDNLNIANQLFTLEDPNGSLTIDQVKLPEYIASFKPSDKVILSFGFTESIQWLHFNFDNTANEDLVLEIAHAFLPITELYYDNPDGSFQKIEAGYNVPLNEKIIKHHLQVFPIPKGKHTYFVRIMSHSHPIPVKIYKASTYEVKTYRQRLVYGFYLGFMAFVILSNLFFYVSLRNKMYLFYAGIVLIYISYASSVMDGFILYFIPKLDLMFWYVTIPTIGVPLQMIYALVFLEMSKYSPKLFRYTKWLIIYFFIYVIVKFFLPMTAVLAINTIHALISFFVMGFLGYISGKRGNRVGYYFALAYFIYFILVLAEATYIQIGSPAYFAELSHVALATLIEAFLLSFLLSKRFEFEKEETELAKKEAQTKLIEKTLENEKIVKDQNAYLEEQVKLRTEDLEKSIKGLKDTQAQLIQSEKMASLVLLTAGVAHEIQNPLNFVNNFSEINTELIDEIEISIEQGYSDNVKELLQIVKQNELKIYHHGKRADTIVKGMLQHAKSSAGQKELTDINELCNEYIRLSFNGLRAKDKLFNVAYKTEFDDSIPKVQIIPQDIGRVILNLLTNAFHAVSDLKAENKDGYEPLVTVKTKYFNQYFEIKVVDNGKGIPKNIINKIFQPFFTTKPTGQGTGLGLSLSYDIITKGHSGELNVMSEEGMGATFTIKLPI